MDYISEAKRLRPLIERAVQSLPDAEAMEAVTLYPHWQEDVLLVAGQRVQYEGVLYVVLTNHRTQAAWTPPAAPSLFARVLIPDPDQVPPWVQPDSTNPYSKGDRVTHNGATWVSDIDGNVCEPGVYGWTEVTA